MRRLIVPALIVLVLVTLNPSVEFSHHSVAANFDQTRTLDIIGIVKKIEIRNPHSEITLKVEKPGGGFSEYHVEWSDKNSLMRRTVPVTKMHIGDKVTINVNPNRRLPDVGYFRTALLPDGTVLRDCGFTAFRESVANGTKIAC